MDASYTANPRFDPQRNAAELGLRTIPVFFLGGTDDAGSTNETVTVSNRLPKLPWVRIVILALIVWGICRLPK